MFQVPTQCWTSFVLRSTLRTLHKNITAGAPPIPSYGPELPENIITELISVRTFDVKSEIIFAPHVFFTGRRV